MNHRSVLNVHSIAHSDGVYITPHHGIEPKSTLIAALNIAYNGGVVGNPAVTSKNRTDSFNGANKWHIFSLVNYLFQPFYQIFPFNLECPPKWLAFSVSDSSEGHVTRRNAEGRRVFFRKLIWERIIERVININIRHAV